MQARILVIEDDPASQQLMSYLLSAHGYQPITASRGDQGLETARRERPDLIICDIQLPGLDGCSIARALKQDSVLRTIPLVAVTALAMVGDRDAILSAGFDAYVSKPIDPEQFVPHIEPLLGVQPRSSLQLVPPGQPAKLHHSPAYRGTILIVDDSEVNLELKRSILEPSGYRIVTASTVADGLHLARREAPALIISDIGLPGASGLDFLSMARIDPRLENIPIIIMTSTHGEPQMRRTAISLGAARFLIRPLEAEQVLAEVEACLAEAHGDARGHHFGR